jgi:peptidoglycan biosynthesis protein MviN/MurJ (putative lipid II flippase)
VVGAIINIAATLILTPIFGLMGVVAGTVIGQVCGSLYFLWLFHRLRGLDWRSTMVEWLWRLTLATVAASFMLWSACRFIPVAWFASRAEGVVALALLGIAYLVVSFAFLWILGFWNSNDFDLVDELTPDLLAAQLSRYRTARS